MLVLTRKIDEQILIGDDVKITLIRVRGGSVRIGIEAPRSVRVVRGELGQLDGAKSPEQLATEPLANDVELEMDGDIDDLAQVFAHPQDQVKTGTRAVSNRVARENGERPAKVFVGTVRRSGAEPKLTRAPLASFVSAT